MPQYALEYGRVSGLSALCYAPISSRSKKSRCCVNFVQIGIDLGGMIRAGHPGGRVRRPRQRAQASHYVRGDFARRRRIGQHQQIVSQGELWRGRADGLRPFLDRRDSCLCRSLGNRRGHRTRRNRVRTRAVGPVRAHAAVAVERWQQDQRGVSPLLHERRVGAERRLRFACCMRRSSGITMPFLTDVDRWMYENDSEFVKTVKADTGRDFDQERTRQGQFSDPFVNEMWSRHRTELPAPTDGWKQLHDDSYYRAAVASPE